MCVCARVYREKKGGDLVKKRMVCVLVFVYIVCVSASATACVCIYE